MKPRNAQTQETKINPVSNLGRHLDIMRQGFMKPLPKARPKKDPPPIVGCDDCLNWHRKGKHTATPEQRKINRAARKARDAELAKRHPKL